jgi:integrase
MREKQIVRLWRRPSRDGKSFAYYLRFKDLDYNDRSISLGHSDLKKAKKQRLQKEKELRMGFCPVGSMRLSEFSKDCLERCGDSIRETSKTDYQISMKRFIEVVGDIDIQKVTHHHGELFRQASIDAGNSPYTVAKKLRGLKVLFNLAVKRGQLEENPLQAVKPPKVTKKTRINTYSKKQCSDLLIAATGYQDNNILEWDLVITMAFTLGMRKSEILNLVWSDIDFDRMSLEITPKENTKDTWEWQIKDTDSRVLPLTPDIAQLLIDLQNRRPVGYPYVFVPPKRYDRIQAIRNGQSRGRKKTWTITDANGSVINNFTKMFKEIKDRAGISKGEFHDLRRTAITNWFYAGLKITEVMRLCGHENYDTTLKYYLAVKDDLIDRARLAMQSVGQEIDLSLLERE